MSLLSQKCVFLKLFNTKKYILTKLNNKLILKTIMERFFCCNGRKMYITSKFVFIYS